MWGFIGLYRLLWVLIGSYRFLWVFVGLAILAP